MMVSVGRPTFSFFRVWDDLVGQPTFSLVFETTWELLVLVRSAKAYMNHT